MTFTSATLGCGSAPPVWHFPDFARAGMAVLAAAATAGCMVTGPPQIEKGSWFKPRASLPPCALFENVQMWTDSTVVPTRRAFSGTPRTRAEVAVLVVHNRLYRGNVFATISATAVDRQAEVWAQHSKGSGSIRLPFMPAECSVYPDCYLLALLPGSHGLTLEAVSEEEGKRSSRVQRRVWFTAKAGGSYSILACQPSPNKKPVLWVRDEKSLKCVSAACPPEEELPEADDVPVVGSSGEEGET